MKHCAKSIARNLRWMQLGYYKIAQKDGVTENHLRRIDKSNPINILVQII